METSFLSMAVSAPAEPDRRTGVLQVQDVILYPSERRVMLRGAPVALSALEFDLLHALMRRSGQVLSREALEAEIYTWRAAVASNAVEVHVHYLRKKLGRAVIRTVRGEGYVMPGQAGKALP